MVSAAFAGVQYLESEKFAGFVKKLLSDRSPQRLGVSGDFSNLRLYFFPPGVGIENPKIKVEKDNVSKIPLEGDIEAKELRVRFAPIQMLSGTIEVSLIEVNSGAVQGKMYSDAFRKNAPKEDAPKTALSWKDLLELRIQGVQFEDTYLNVQVELPQPKRPWASAEFVVKKLRLEREKKGKTATLVSSAWVNAVKLDLPPSVVDLPIRDAHQLKWSFRLTDEGLNLEPFEADLAGIHLEVNGKIFGDILQPEGDLKIQAKSLVQADLNTFFNSNFSEDHWRGDARVEADVSGKLSDLTHTLKAQYRISGTGLRWKDVQVEQMSGSGSLDLGRRRIELKEFDLADADDGRARVENLLIPLDWNEGFQAKVFLTRARLHWVGGAVLEDVYPLEGKISGKIEADFRPKSKTWWLGVLTDLTVDQFALNNQKFGVSRKKKYILRPRSPIRLHGPLELTPQGLQLKNFEVSMRKSRFKVDGTIGGKSGFDFKANGPLGLSDIDQIAENPISGDGMLNAWIHGPGSGVILDFGVELKDSEYLGMKFGNLNGTVTYDDGISELRFSDISAVQRSTRYSLKQGSIDLNSDQMDLPIQIQSGKVEDIAWILDRVVKKVSWYPQSLVGDVRGEVHIGGGTGVEQMEIRANLEGSDWIWVGERASKLKMQVGLDRGTYYAKEVRLTKTQGSVVGEIQFNSNNDQIDWNFATEKMSLVDLDFFQRLEIPARSLFSISSQGSGNIERVRSKSEARFFQTQVKGEQLEPSVMQFDVGESTARASLQVFGSRLLGQMKFALTPRQPSSVKLDFSSFDFTPLLLILNPKLLDDPELSGVIDGKIQLDFLSEQSELARGEIRLQKYHLQKSGFRLDLAEPIQIPLQLGYFSFGPATFKFQGSAVQVSGKGERGDVKIQVRGAADLALAEFLTSSIQEVRGVAQTELVIEGPLKALRLNGDIQFDDAVVRLRSLQTVAEDVSGKIRLRNGTFFVQSLNASLGDAGFDMAGKIETFADRFPVLDLKLNFYDNKLKLLPLSLVQVRGPAFVRGEQMPYTVSGSLDVGRALWTKSFQSSGGANTRGERFAPAAANKQLGTSLFALDLNLSAAQGFFVKNEIVDAEFRGKVRMIGTPENPRLLGEGSLVQGKILFRDRPFVFESVKIDFDDPFELNPSFTASAVSEVNQYKVKVLAFGRADKWKAEFSSTPYLAEADIFSLLTSGLTATESGRFRSRDRTYVSQGEAASLILHSLDFSRDVQSRTGFQFDVEEAIDNQMANSIFRPQTQDQNVAAPKLVIKRNLGRKFNLSFGSTVGVGNQNQREVNAEYRLTSGVSLRGVWNNIEEVNIRETRTSFGFDLKFNRKFK